MEEYALASAKAAYKIQDNRHQMDSWHQVEKFRDQKMHPPGWTGNVHFPPSLTGTDNTRWETVAVCMSMSEEAIRVKHPCGVLGTYQLLQVSCGQVSHLQKVPQQEGPERF